MPAGATRVKEEAQGHTPQIDTTTSRLTTQFKTNIDRCIQRESKQCHSLDLFAIVCSFVFSCCSGWCHGKGWPSRHLPQPHQGRFRAFEEGTPGQDT